VHGTRQNAILYLAEAGEVGLQVRAAPLDTVTIDFPELVLWGLFGVVSLNVLKPLGRRALEENVHVLVVWSFALRLEAAGEEEIVHPILYMANNAGFD